eukprot:m.43920 g.43920  ORF g.43920 m.43920 type:complete len:98 (-) comp10571_c0_seq2:1363-1656(-)
MDVSDAATCKCFRMAFQLDKLLGEDSNRHFICGCFALSFPRHCCGTLVDDCFIEKFFHELEAVQFSQGKILWMDLKQSIPSSGCQSVSQSVSIELSH